MFLTPFKLFKNQICRDTKNLHEQLSLSAICFYIDNLLINKYSLKKDCLDIRQSFNNYLNEYKEIKTIESFLRGENFFDIDSNYVIINNELKISIQLFEMLEKNFKVFKLKNTTIKLRKMFISYNVKKGKI